MVKPLNSNSSSEQVSKGGIENTPAQTLFKLQNPCAARHFRCAQKILGTALNIRHRDRFAGSLIHFYMLINIVKYREINLSIALPRVPRYLGTKDQKSQRRPSQAALPSSTKSCRLLDCLNTSALAIPCSAALRG